MKASLLLSFLITVFPHAIVESASGMEAPQVRLTGRPLVGMHPHYGGWASSYLHCSPSGGAGSRTAFTVIDKIRCKTNAKKAAKKFAKNICQKGGFSKVKFSRDVEQFDLMDGVTNHVIGFNCFESNNLFNETYWLDIRNTHGN